VQDYYKILGVDRDVDDKSLKRLYRKLALQHHPDKADLGEKDAAEARFAEINEAYEVLSDPEKRQLHDAGEDPFGSEGSAGGGGGFHQGFGGFGGFSGGFPGGGGTFQQGGRTFNVRFG
jgi:DnaJ-class molecular chaperone